VAQLDRHFLCAEISVDLMQIGMAQSSESRLDQNLEVVETRCCAHIKECGSSCRAGKGELDGGWWSLVDWTAHVPTSSAVTSGNARSTSSRGFPNSVTAITFAITESMAGERVSESHLLGSRSTNTRCTKKARVKATSAIVVVPLCRCMQTESRMCVFIWISSTRLSPAPLDVMSLTHCD
jgi:hypothetical protein